MSTLPSITNRIQAPRSPTSLSSPTCSTRGHPTHRQATCGQRMRSANAGHRKPCRIFQVRASLHSPLDAESSSTSILEEEISIPHTSSPCLGVHDWTPLPSSQFLGQAWVCFHVKERVFPDRTPVMSCPDPHQKSHGSRRGHGRRS